MITLLQTSCSHLYSLVDEFNSECTDSQLNAEHWFARIKKLYNRNRSFLCVSCLHKLFMQFICTPCKMPDRFIVQLNISRSALVFETSSRFYQGQDSQIKYPCISARYYFNSISTVLRADNVLYMQGRFYVGAGGHRPPQMLARPPKYFGSNSKIRIVKIQAIFVQW